MKFNIDPEQLNRIIAEMSITPEQAIERLKYGNGLVINATAQVVEDDPHPVPQIGSGTKSLEGSAVLTDDQKDTLYIQGNRAAWLSMLGECLRHLGYDSPEAQNVRWIKEREETIAVLRELCEDFGDNDWDETLYLADVVDKHLGKHLHATEKD